MAGSDHVSPTVCSTVVATLADSSPYGARAGSKLVLRGKLHFQVMRSGDEKYESSALSSVEVGVTDSARSGIVTSSVL